MVVEGGCITVMLHNPPCYIAVGAAEDGSWELSFARDSARAAESSDPDASSLLGFGAAAQGAKATDVIALYPPSSRLQ